MSGFEIAGLGLVVAVVIWRLIPFGAIGFRNGENYWEWRLRRMRRRGGR